MSTSIPRALVIAFVTPLVLALVVIAGVLASVPRHHHPAAPTLPIVKQSFLIATPVMGLPPYWRQVAPSWCQEDMPCWIGSSEDGRSARSALADWHTQMHKLADFDPSDELIGVIAQDGETDGSPLWLPRMDVSGVHHCTGTGQGRTCLARVQGLSHLVFVAGVDFPGAH